MISNLTRTEALWTLQNTSLNLADSEAKNEHVTTDQDLSFMQSLAEPYGSSGQESAKKMSIR